MKAFHKTATSEVGTSDAGIRRWTLNVALTIGTLATVCFGIHDALQHRILPALASLLVIIIFSLMLLVNISIPRFRKIIDTGFVALVGAVLLALLATQFPAPTITFWCFTFPLLALFLLGRDKGVFALILSFST